jgi:polyphosphate kinase
LPIRLLVRGICALRPGVEGVSDTIQVHSVIGRFLEHGRAFVAENGGRPEVLVGSADLMGRNLYRRVECAVPLLDPQARDEVREVLELSWADRRQSWNLQPDGDWTRIDPGSTDPGIQEELIRRARARPLAWEGKGRRAAGVGPSRG